MTKKLLLTGIIITLFFPAILWAQLSGTKTIGGSNADYATFSAAATALNSQGVNGAVTFNVAAGTYTEQFTLGTISGASATNTITFKSAANDSTQVTLQYASSTNSTNNYVVKFDGADYVTFKNMTIERTGTNTYCTVIEIAGSSNNNHFIGNIIKNGGSSAVTYASLIYAPNTNGYTHNGTHYIGNKFVNGGVAIYNFGPTTTNLATGALIKNNEFVNQGKYTIYLSNHSAPEISGNSITATTGSTSYIALKANGVKGGLKILNNKISIANGTIIFMQTCDGLSTKGLIANNFMSASGTSVKGINFSNSLNQHIYFNSINLSNSGTGFYLTVNGSGANRFKNNIVKVGSGGYCMDISNINAAFTALDYNDYYFPGGSMGKIAGTTYSTFAAWKTASGQDAHSMNDNPNFISNTDLHIVSSNIALKGTSANTTPSVSVDIDGQTRNNLTPDIGADEFTITDLAITAIILDTQMCIGAKYNMVVDIKNVGSASYTGYVPVLYQLGNASSVQLGLANLQNLAPGATFTYMPTTQITANPLGNHAMKVMIVPQNDADGVNDTMHLNILISNYPVSNLPNDTSACAGNTIVLDPGQGYDSYKWYNGDTTSTLAVDSTGIGIGGKWISVKITHNGCAISDSTLVLFKDCTGIKQSNLSKAMNIYPNPAANVVHIEVSQNYILRRIRVISIDGQVVLEKTEGDLHRISINDLSKGVYYLYIESSEGTALKKLIIQ
jgi:hypothetical protein